MVFITQKLSPRDKNATPPQPSPNQRLILMPLLDTCTACLVMEICRWAAMGRWQHVKIPCDTILPNQMQSDDGICNHMLDQVTIIWLSLVLWKEACSFLEWNNGLSREPCPSKITKTDLRHKNPYFTKASVVRYKRSWCRCHVQEQNKPLVSFAPCVYSWLWCPPC